MLLSEGILFFAKGFLFLAKSKSSRVWFHFLDIWNVLFFFFSFLLSGYFCSVDACIFCIVFGSGNHSSSVFFETMYRFNHTIFNASDFECCSKWTEAYIGLQAFFRSLQLFFHVVYPFEFSVMIFLFQHFARKLFCLACFQLLICVRTVFPYWLVTFFSLFWNICFALIVWFCVRIFLVFLLSPVSSDLSLRVVSFVLIVLLCSFRPNIFFLSLYIFNCFIFLF